MNKKDVNVLLSVLKNQTHQTSSEPYFLILEIFKNERNFYTFDEIDDIKNRVSTLYISILINDAHLLKVLSSLDKTSIYILSTVPDISTADSYFNYQIDQRFIKINELYFNQFVDRPYVTLSFGMSLDGKIATKTGDSKYISGKESRVFVHELRNRHDGILVGINTVRIDHPLLTTRLNRPSKNPIRIVLDSELSISLDEPILNSDITSKTIIVTKKNVDMTKVKQIEDLGHQVINLSTNHKPLPLAEVLKRLKSIGINSLLVEGGSTIHFSFIESGAFDKIYATISPIVIGGKESKGAVEGSGFETLKDSKKLVFNRVFKRGIDYIIEALPRKEENI